MDKEYIKAKLANLPEDPGSYQMKDKNGEIIYVGKAKNLHSRVNQYFTGAHDFKTTRLVSEIEDFDLTKEELERIDSLNQERPLFKTVGIDNPNYKYNK